MIVSSTWLSPIFVIFTFCYRSESHSLGMMHLTRDPCLVIGRAVSDFPAVSFIQGSNYIVLFQKISILPPPKGLEFPGGVGFSKTRNFKKCLKCNWNFQRVGVWIFSGTAHVLNNAYRGNNLNYLLIG